MEQMEKVECLREKTGCTYTEAKAALAETNGDMLEALCWLEQHGKTQMVGASGSTAHREPPKTEPEPEPTVQQESAFHRGCRALYTGLADLIRKGNRNELVMTNRHDKREFGIPVTLFVVLLVAAFWVVVPLLVIALFCGNRLSFQGAELGKDQINDAMGKATDFAEGIKQEFTEKK